MSKDTKLELRSLTDGEIDTVAGGKMHAKFEYGGIRVDIWASADGYQVLTTNSDTGGVRTVETASSPR